eukprot:TRINITY_DN2838_c1_g1_i1.p1 TRINITY_DN2838_c1_g1~~TRINITY_DN2838_c1_g1_i1.p1  ORF type:complete len:215 (+),score=53.76 TRINITY_DN2838_c1_g1_i1:64-645(+)
MNAAIGRVYSYLIWISYVIMLLFHFIELEFIKFNFYYLGFYLSFEFLMKVIFMFKEPSPFTLISKLLQGIFKEKEVDPSGNRAAWTAGCVMSLAIGIFGTILDNQIVTLILTLIMFIMVTLQAFNNFCVMCWIIGQYKKRVQGVDSCCANGVCEKPIETAYDDLFGAAAAYDVSDDQVKNLEVDSDENTSSSN